MSCRSDTETFLNMELQPEAEKVAKLLEEMPVEVQKAMLNQMIGVKMAAQLYNPSGDKRSA
ncbi:hypothetical protein [Enterocloster lavalensis]|uniref:hypothetical protein n=1 Tax=Enterocloster lavalensis TaxID=460384 RepID=UPI002FDA4C4F